MQLELVGVVVALRPVGVLHQLGVVPRLRGGHRRLADPREQLAFSGPVTA